MGPVKGKVSPEIIYEILLLHFFLWCFFGGSWKASLPSPSEVSRVSNKSSAAPVSTDAEGSTSTTLARTT